MKGHEVRFKLEVLYAELSKLAEIKRKIENLQRDIKSVKENCEHDEAYVKAEGTEFDGYDRNEYFADIICPDCGTNFTVYDRNKTKKYKIIDGVSELNVWRR